MATTLAEMAFMVKRQSQKHVKDDKMSEEEITQLRCHPLVIHIKGILNNTRDDNRIKVLFTQFQRKIEDHIWSKHKSNEPLELVDISTNNLRWSDIKRLLKEANGRVVKLSGRYMKDHKYYDMEFIDKHGEMCNMADINTMIETKDNTTFFEIRVDLSHLNEYIGRV
jgi:hypothetical protein